MERRDHGNADRITGKTTGSWEGMARSPEEQPVLQQKQQDHGME
jgi:hypothetical protein